MSTPSQQPRILITGAGIAGPTLAYYLTRTPLSPRVTLLERSPNPRATGQAIDIHNRGVEIARHMGILSEIKARHTTETGTVFVNSDGKISARFDALETMTSEVEILRADLAEIVMGKVQGRKGVEVKYGDYVTALDDTSADEEGVHVTFNSGAQETFDMVIGSDGSSSKMRNLILPEADRKDCYTFLGQYIAFFSIPRVPSDTNVWTWYAAPKAGGLGLMTRPHRHIEGRSQDTMGAYLCVTQPTRETRDARIEEALEKGTGPTKALLGEYFTGAGWESERLLEGMDNADDFYMSRIGTVRLPRWTSGRCGLIGDAASATMGVGTTIAFEQAYFLAGEFGKIKSVKEIPEALERYEKVYRPLYEKYGSVPKGFPQAAFPQTWWGRAIKDGLLWGVSKSKAYRLIQMQLPWAKTEEVKLPEYEWVGEQ